MDSFLYDQSQGSSKQAAWERSLAPRKFERALPSSKLCTLPTFAGMPDELQEAAASVVMLHPKRIEELSPKRRSHEDVLWHELERVSRNWMPASALERQGHPGHSMEAFHVVYDLKNQIARGGCATVHLAVRRRTHKVVAVKRIRASANMTHSEVVSEYEVMKKLDHDHIIRTFDAFWSTNPAGVRDEFWLVQELAQGGELFKWCRSLKRPLGESDYRRLAFELLSGLAYLHAHGIIHRDIKPKNLLMADASESSPLRIADFGLCRWLKRERRTTSGSGLASSEDALVTSTGASNSRRAAGQRRARAITKSFLGTADWMAPEVLVCAVDGAGGYSFPADVWASGCVIYALIAERFDDTSPYTPYGDDSAEGLFGAVLAGLKTVHC